MVIGGTFTKAYKLIFLPSNRTSDWWERKNNILFQLHLFMFVTLTSVQHWCIWSHVQGQVWKRVWIFEARSENGCGKCHFLVWNWVWIWRCGRHIPNKNSKEYPPRGMGGEKHKGFQPSSVNLVSSPQPLKKSFSLPRFVSPYLYMVGRGRGGRGSRGNIAWLVNDITRMLRACGSACERA